MNEEKIFDSVFNDLKPLLQEINAHDPYTLLHSIQVAKLVEAYCITEGKSQKETGDLIAAALIHDYGKLKVDPKILNKNGRPTEEEREKIQTHAAFTGTLLKSKINKINSPYLTKYIILAAAQHHEKEDGKGYPLGLKADKILPEAKVLHVADVFDALASERPYKKASSPEYIYRTFAGDYIDDDTKKWVVAEQTEFDVSVLQKFLFEMSLDMHAEIEKKSLEYMHQVNPTYDPAKEFAKAKGKENIDDVISNKTVKSNAGIDNSTLQMFLSNKKFISSAENIELRELCTMKKVIDEMRKSDSVFVEVNPDTPGAKIFSINGYRFAFKEFDKATKEERTFTSKVTDGYCRGSLTGTLIGNDAIKEAEIKENQNKGL